MGGKPLNPQRPFGLQGIVNLSPDSFFDGSAPKNLESVLAHAGKLLDEGTAILDLGAESTRPGAQALEQGEEQQRLMPALQALGARWPKALISVDTYHAQTAALALGEGVSVINDISACRGDPELLDVLAQYRPGYVLTYNRGCFGNMGLAPDHADLARGDVLGDVVKDAHLFFERGLSRLVNAGLPEAHVALDPGIGFAKSLEDNIALLGHISEFLDFGRPLLVGLSMKSFFGGLLGLELKKRGPATATACALLWERGVFWHRVHDPAAARQALELAVALAGESPAGNSGSGHGF